MYVLFLLLDTAFGVWASYGLGVWSYCWRVPLVVVAGWFVGTTLVQYWGTRRPLGYGLSGFWVGVAMAALAFWPRWYAGLLWLGLQFVKAHYVAARSSAHAAADQEPRF